jgi:predicted permease
MVSPGFISTIGGSIVAGRDFTWADNYEVRPVAMVSENLARELWGQPSAAIGKYVRPYPNVPWREVVGVVTDMRDNGVNEGPTAAAYWPLLMKDFFSASPEDSIRPQRGVTLVIRSSRAGTTGLVSDLGQAVWSINPNLPLADVRTLQDIYDRSLARTSFTLVMLGSAGGMALLLGIAGIYGVISYSVSQRTREIGIRIALGAQAQTVTRMFVVHGLALAAIGVAIGLAGAFALRRTMSTLLFEIKPDDPLTYVLVSLALVAATGIASYVPALRATSVDPIEALRAE